MNSWESLYGKCMKVQIGRHHQDQVGADINYCGSKGRTPLAYASAERLTEITKCLLNDGAGRNIANDLRMTPIEEAALMSKHWTAKILFPLTHPIPTVHEWSVAGILTQINYDEPRGGVLQSSSTSSCLSRIYSVPMIHWFC